MFLPPRFVNRGVQIPGRISRIRFWFALPNAECKRLRKVAGVRRAGGGGGGWECLGWGCASVPICKRLLFRRLVDNRVARAGGLGGRGRGGPGAGGRGPGAGGRGPGPRGGARGPGGAPGGRGRGPGAGVGAGAEGRGPGAGAAGGPGAGAGAAGVRLRPTHRTRRAIHELFGPESP